MLFITNIQVIFFVDPHHLGLFINFNDVFRFLQEYCLLVKKLITHTKISIADAAENAGFGSRQRLSQIFRDKGPCSSAGHHHASGTENE